MGSGGSAACLDRYVEPLCAAERSAGRQADRSGTLRQLMSRARIACPGFDTDPSGDIREAPEEDVGIAFCRDAKVAAGTELLQLEPFRLQAGKADAVVLKKLLGVSQAVAPLGTLLGLKAYALVADAAPG